MPIDECPTFPPESRELCDYPLCKCVIEDTRVMSESEFYAGQIVFDKKRTDVTDDLMAVVDPDVGEVDDLDPETRRLVVGNDTNQRFGVADTTPCVATAYIEGGEDTPPKVGRKTYTFPVTRLETVHSHDGNAIGGFHPYQWAVSHFLASLFEQVLLTESMTVEEFQVVCMRADIDGKAITKATELVDRSRRPPLGGYE